MMSFPSLFLLASFAPGLSSGPDSTVFLETTVVTASRTEQRLENTTVSVDVLPLRVLEEKANARVEQVIQMSPGVTLQDGQANIRSKPLVSLNHLTVPVTVDILFYLSFKNVTVLSHKLAKGTQKKQSQRRRSTTRANTICSQRPNV